MFVLGFVPATKIAHIYFPLCFCSITRLTLSSRCIFIFSVHSTPGTFSRNVGAEESKTEQFALFVVLYGNALAVETFMNPSTIELF